MPLLIEWHSITGEVLPNSPGMAARKQRSVINVHPLDQCELLGRAIWQRWKA